MSHKHDLADDFPQHRQRIHDLKLSNAHFAKLYEEFDALEHEIHRADTDIQPMADEHMEELKRRRLHLKDEMLRMVEEDVKND